jgi:spore coat protein U-like protein
MMRFFPVLAAGAAAALLALAPARAATLTANMNVSIQITAACTVSVTNIAYGTQPGTFLSVAQTSTAAMGGLFSYTCTPGNGVAPALTASNGNNFLAGSNRMKGGVTAKFIPYSLAMPAIAAFTGSAQTAQITATIPAQAPLPSVDTYTDTVLLTLTY